MKGTERLQQLIEAAMPGAVVQVANPENDELHYEAVVVSEEFEHLPLVKQHQRVMQAVKEEFGGAVHALKLKTYTPVQWKMAQSNRT